MLLTSPSDMAISILQEESGGLVERGGQERRTPKPEVARGARTSRTSEIPRSQFLAAVFLWLRNRSSNFKGNAPKSA